MNILFHLRMIDFLMLEYYGERYKDILSDKEGPRLKVQVSNQTRLKNIKEIENTSQHISEYNTRVSEDTRHTLKECGGNGSTYSDEQKKLMVWYTYFFLNRGKPSTHIEALSIMDDKTLLSSIPPVFKKIVSKAELIIKDYSNENYQS